MRVRKDDLAADRQPDGWPGDQFVVVGLAIAAIIVLLALMYVTGVVKP